MKPRRHSLLSLSLLTAAGWSVRAAMAQVTPDYGVIIHTAGQMLMEMHYLPVEIDDRLSTAALDRWLARLDPQRLYYTAEDIAALYRQHGTSLDDAVFLSDIRPFRALYNDYVARVRTRLDQSRAMLQGDALTFTGQDTAPIDRSQAAWAPDTAALDALWRSILRNEVLEELLSHTPPDPVPDAATCAEYVLERYTATASDLRNDDDEAACDHFLSSLAQACDPHSDYFTAAEEREFTQSMEKNLCGIGVQLDRDHRSYRVASVMKESPASRSGNLFPGDEILAFWQDGEWDALRGLSMEEVLTRMRGKAGTRLKLLIRRPGSAPVEVALVRANVEILADLAAGSIVTMADPRPGTPPLKLGVIRFSDFYGPTSTGAATGHTLSGDVRKLLRRMTTEDVKGLVIDVRSNGGGLLDEAVKLTGLIAGPGPVVQQRSREGDTHTWTSSGPSLWQQPVLVLTDRQSASAAEIFAAALKDRGRAIIAGDPSTYGKGTVQLPEPVAPHLEAFTGMKQAGTLKVTTAKFYRITGDSTQKVGVGSDILIPSRYGDDALKFGERWEPAALPEDRIAPLTLPAPPAPLPLAQLQERSKARLDASPEFTAQLQDTAEKVALLRSNIYSLNEAARRADAAREKATKTTRTAAAAAQAPALLSLHTLDTTKPADPAKPILAPDAPTPPPESLPDLATREGLHILRDLITLPAPPQVAKAPQPTLPTGAN